MKLENKYQGIIFDMDGTLYRGDEIIPGAAEVISRLRALGHSLLFVTNKTTNSSADYVAFLRRHGFEINESEIITATDVICDYLESNYKSRKFFAIGEQSFIDEITKRGLKYSENKEEIEIVIVTLDRELTLRKLEIAAHSIERGARFLAANIDDTCPVEGDEIWDAGSTIAALEKRTHHKLEMHFGKPSQFMIDKMFSKLNVPKEKLLLVGDRLETDITMANAAGISSALVRTGVKNDLHNNSVVQPDYVINSVADLLKEIK